MLIKIPSGHLLNCGRASRVRCFCIKRRLARRLPRRNLQYTIMSRYPQSRLFFVVPRLYYEHSRRPRDIFQYCAAPTTGRRRPGVRELGRCARTSSTRHTRPSTHHTSRPRPRHSRSRRAGRLFAERSARRARPANFAAARSLVVRRAAGAAGRGARRRPSTSFHAIEQTRRWREAVRQASRWYQLCRVLVFAALGRQLRKDQ